MQKPNTYADIFLLSPQIMMLKLRGHPPVLMRRQEGEEPTQLSNTFSKVMTQIAALSPYTVSITALSLYLSITALSLYLSITTLSLYLSIQGRRQQPKSGET